MKLNFINIFKRKKKINPLIEDFERGYILRIDDNVNNKEYFKNLDNGKHT